MLTCICDDDTITCDDTTRRHGVSGNCGVAGAALALKRLVR